MANLDDEIDFFKESQLLVGSNDRIETLSFQILHDEVGISLVISQFKYSDDIGMLQAARGLSFAEESFQQIRIVGIPAGHHLDGDQAVEKWIGGLVDDTHPAATNHIDHVVLADLRWF